MYVDRSHLRALPDCVAEIAARLRSGHTVLAFPEGTTWCGPPGGVFRRAPFQAAIDAGVRIVPVTVEYFQDGIPSPIAAFVGDDTLLASPARVSAARSLTLRVRAHSSLAPGRDRRILAASAQHAVHSGLTVIPDGVHV